MSDMNIEYAARELVKAKVRAKGTPRERRWPVGAGKHYVTIHPRSWTVAEYELYKAVQDADAI